MKMKNYLFQMYIIIYVVLVDILLVDCRCPDINVRNLRPRYRRRRTKVKYRCSGGFTLVGEKMSFCVNNKWAPEPPICISSGCLPIIPSTNLEPPTELYGGGMLDFTCAPGYKLIGAEKIHCDGTNWSDSVPTCQELILQTHCEFETPDLCGWTQDDTDTSGFDWELGTGTTVTGGTGPHNDHTYGNNTGHYLFIEASQPRMDGDQARLLSEMFPTDLSGTCFDFWYHMLGPEEAGHVGALEVFVRPDGELLDDIQPSFSVENNQGDEWKRGFLEIPVFTEPFQIIIQATRRKSYVSDISIDDFRIFNCSDETTTTSTTPAPTTITTTTTTTTTTIPTTSTIVRETTMTSTSKATTPVVQTTVTTLVPSTTASSKLLTALTSGYLSTRLKSLAPTASSAPTDTSTATTTKTSVPTTTTTSSSPGQTSVPSTSRMTSAIITQTRSTYAPTTVTTAIFTPSIKTTTTTTPTSTLKPSTTTTTIAPSTTLKPSTKSTSTPQPETDATTTTVIKTSKTTNTLTTTTKTTPSTQTLMETTTTKQTPKSTTLTTATRTTELVTSSSTAMSFAASTSRFTSSVTGSSTEAGTTAKLNSSPSVITNRASTRLSSANRTSSPLTNPSIASSAGDNITIAGTDQDKSIVATTRKETGVVKKGKSSVKDENLTPLLIGIGVGIVAGLIVIAIIAWFCRRKRKLYNQQFEDELKPITTSGSVHSLNNGQCDNNEDDDNYHDDDFGFET